jgi:hypothetical protein
LTVRRQATYKQKQKGPPGAGEMLLVLFADLGGAVVVFGPAYL